MTTQAAARIVHCRATAELAAVERSVLLFAQAEYELQIVAPAPCVLRVQGRDLGLAAVELRQAGLGLSPVARIGHRVVQGVGVAMQTEGQCVAPAGPVIRRGCPN